MGLFPSLFLKVVKSDNQVYIRKQYIDLKTKVSSLKFSRVASKSIQ